MLCPFCQNAMEVGRYDCSRCGVGCDGDFTLPRIARLPADMLELAEQVLLAGGNLKEVAGRQEISYPTLRKRVDALIAALRELQRDDEARVAELLHGVERDEVRPEYAARRIAEIRRGS